MTDDTPFLCWPPGTEPEEKDDWKEYHPIMLWAKDEEAARKRLMLTITDAADWEIEPWKIWRDDDGKKQVRATDEKATEGNREEKTEIRRP